MSDEQKTIKRLKRFAADNFPISLRKRLIGEAKRQCLSESALVRLILHDSLPPLSEVENFLPEDIANVMDKEGVMS